MHAGPLIVGGSVAWDYWVAGVAALKSKDHVSGEGAYGMNRKEVHITFESQ